MKRFKSGGLVPTAHIAKFRLRWITSLDRVNLCDMRSEMVRILWAGWDDETRRVFWPFLNRS